MILLGQDDTSEALRRPLAYGGGGGGFEGRGGVEGFHGGIIITVGCQVIVESLWLGLQIKLLQDVFRISFTGMLQEFELTFELNLVLRRFS